MNSTAILSLIGDLYAQIDALQQEGEAKRQVAEELNAKVLDMQKSLDPLGGPEEAIAQARKESEA